MCFSFKLFSSLINTFFTFNGPSYFSSGYVNYHAIVKFSFDFLAAAIPPSTSSVFPFGRQAKLKQKESTLKLWTGWSLSIDQIWNKRRKIRNQWRLLLPVVFPFVNQLASNEWNYTFIHPSNEEAAKYFVISFHFRPVIKSFNKWKAKIGKTIVMSSKCIDSRICFRVWIVWWLGCLLFLPRQFPKFQ